MRKTQTGRVQAVDRALRLLELVAEAAVPMSLSDLSARSGLHISTAHRLLSALKARGFVEQDGDGGRYRVGAAAFLVGSAFIGRGGLGRRLHPVLVDLAARTGETANLVIRHGTEAIYIDHVVGTRVAKLFTEIGQRVPLHCTAVGKVMLACTTPAGDAAPAAGLDLPRFTPRTIATRRALQRELAAVRGAGYAVDREEHEMGVACIAAPVYDASGCLIAAIGISGPSGRVLRQVGILGGQVRASAAEASRIMGLARARP